MQTHTQDSTQPSERKELNQEKMKFTQSPTVELPVRNTVLSIQQDNNSMHVGTSVWQCSLILVKFIEHSQSQSESESKSSSTNPYAPLLDFRNKRAIELGSGCGVAGMGLHLLGLTDVILTDIAAVMPALKHNLKRNKNALGGKTLKSCILNWGKKDEKTRSMLKGPFDIVIATDVVYMVELVGVLVREMEEMVKDDGFVLLGYQVRSVEADVLFWEVVRVVFEVEKVRHEDLHPEYANEEADVYVLRKKPKALDLL